MDGIQTSTSASTDVNSAEWIRGELVAEAAAIRAARYARIEREIRETRKVEFRDNGDGTVTVAGYASTFDTPYTVTDWLGDYEESVDPAAFDKTLREGADVRLLLNHEGLPLARTKSGTLQLSTDSIGLHYESRLDTSDPDVQRIVPKMSRGDLAESSFAFRTIRQEWNADYTRRKLLEVKLFDVSIVTFPANPATSALLRGVELLEALAAWDPQELELELREAGELSADVIARATETLERIRGVRTESGAASRDRAVTMSLATARRQLELLELELRR